MRVRGTSPAAPARSVFGITLIVSSLLLVSCGGTPTVTPASSFRLSTTASTTTLREAATFRGITVGAAVATDRLNDSQYEQVLGDEFSQLTAEWEMKFGQLHPRPDAYNFTTADRLVDYALVHHMQVRGHTLLWHEAVPRWLTSGGYSSAEMHAIARDHITSVVQHFGTNVYAWDVVNEPFNDDGSMRSSPWYDSPGIGYASRGTKYIEQALLWARDANPEAKLFVNDYGAERMNRKSDALYAMAADFKRRGIPLDGIGFQMHLDLTANSTSWLASVEKNFKRFANLGLEIHITELDVRLSNASESDLDAQAELYSKIAKLCVSNSKCKVLQTWGFTDRYSWVNSFYQGMGWALPFDSQYAKKPAYFGLHQGLTN